jgi:hypothetical protein
VTHSNIYPRTPAHQHAIQSTSTRTSDLICLFGQGTTPQRGALVRPVGGESSRCDDQDRGGQTGEQVSASRYTWGRAHAPGMTRAHTAATGIAAMRACPVRVGGGSVGSGTGGAAVADESRKSNSTEVISNRPMGQA